MRTDILKALIENSTLLVVAYLFLTRLARWEIKRKPVTGLLIQGLVFALSAFLAVLFSVEVLPGVLIDMRAPVLALAAFAGGPVVGIFAIIPILVYRIVIGGVGMFAGIGIILSSFVFGLIIRVLERSKVRLPSLLLQLLLGFGSAAIFLLWALTLPNAFGRYVHQVAALPLSLASVITILAIFYIRSREKSHQILLDRLTEANNLFEEISLDRNIGIMVLQGTSIVYINQPLLSKLGFISFDTSNNDLLSFLDKKTQAMIKPFIEQASHGLIRGAVPMSITLKDGQSLQMLVHARKLQYKQKDSLVFVSVDISKLTDAEKKLQRRFDQLQLALNVSGAILWRASIPEDLLIADKEFENLLSYNPPEDPARFSHWLLEMSLQNDVREQINSLIAGKLDFVSGEMSYKGDDLLNRWFNLRARITKRDSEGLPLEITGIVFETTLIKEKELAVLKNEIENAQSQKMEAIGRLAGGIAHDFNNLLHVVLGYSDILNRVSENDPVISDVSKPIIEAAEKGKELIKQLLLFSREEKPLLLKTDLKAITIDFSKLVSRIMEENIVISTEINVEKAFIFGDRGQIEQVLMNLCVNARDAMPNGGRISIELGKEFVTNPIKVTSGLVKPGPYLTLSVSDTGSGVPEATQESIFEPFFTTKRIDKGTGLGLATVLGIIREHSGYIEVNNLPERGLRIQLYLHQLESTEEISSEPDLFSELPNDTPKNTQSSICVLLAEDDPEVMRLAIEGLGASGIRVISSRNGLDAIKVFKENRDVIDMLVFDVMMPEMNGPDAYREIQLLENDFPIIFTTGYAGDRLADIEGYHVVISKPYSMQELVAAIRRVEKKQ